MSPSLREHWERVHREKDPLAVSWHQAEPTRSLSLLRESKARRIVDAGGGSSFLVDRLLDEPGVEVCVVDISSAALERTRARLGQRRCWAGEQPRVRFVAADLALPIDSIDAGWADGWHDRAAFHFLAGADDRAAYARNLARILRPGGTAIIAGFAPDGPTRCSGLEVARHDGASVEAALNADAAALNAGATAPIVRLERELWETHRTPSGTDQSFAWAILRRC